MALVRRSIRGKVQAGRPVLVFTNRQKPAGANKKAIGLNATVTALHRVFVERPDALNTIRQFLQELLHVQGHGPMQTDKLDDDDMVQLLGAALSRDAVEILRRDPAAMRVMQAAAEAMLGDIEDDPAC